MNYKSFMRDSAMLVRKSYYDTAVMPMFEKSGMSELDFCKRFPQIVTDETDGRIITVLGMGVKISTGDFYQMHDFQGDTCHIEDILNATDDTIDNN